MNAITSKIIRTICYAVIILVIVGLAFWFVAGKILDNIFDINIIGYRIETLTGDYVDRASYEAKDTVRSLDIDWKSSNVAIEVYDGDTVVFVESCQRELKSGELLKYSEKDGVLKIEFTVDNTLTKMAPKKLTVRIPSVMAYEMETVSVNCSTAGIQAAGFSVDSLELVSDTGKIEVSGIGARGNIILHTDTARISANDLFADSINIESDTGSLELNDLKAEYRIDLQSDTGRITADKLICPSVNVDGDTGDFKLNNVETTDFTSDSATGQLTVINMTANTVEAQTDTGDISLDGQIKTAEVRSSTGSITVSDSISVVSLYLKSDTGSITLYTAKDTGLTVHYSSSTGKFTNEFPVLVSGEDEADVIMKTATGNMYIKEYVEE
ncbi:MAG: DUF4097 family beta strand repeat-containing protein [Clostridia bacterium]